MKFFAIAAALISMIPAMSALVINTPSSLVPCQPSLLTYGNGVAPYYLSVIPGGQVSGTPYRVWDPTNAESMTWVVDLASGTSISLSVKDATGALAYSDQVTIQPGSDTSCLNAASSAAVSGSAATRAASSGSAAATGTSTRASSSAAGTPATAGAKPAVTQSASSNAANGAASSSSTPATSGGAFRLTSAAYGVGGAVGLIGALLL